jgi:hypothetical protein
MRTKKAQDSLGSALRELVRIQGQGSGINEREDAISRAKGMLEKEGMSVDSLKVVAEMLYREGRSWPW